MNLNFEEVKNQIFSCNIEENETIPLISKIYSEDDIRSHSLH